MCRLFVSYCLCPPYKYPCVWPRQRLGNCGPIPSSIRVYFRPTPDDLRTCCPAAVFLIFVLSCSLQLTPLPSPARLLLLRLIAIAFTPSPSPSPSLLPLPSPQDIHQASTPTPSLLLFSSSCAFSISRDRSLSIPQELLELSCSVSATLLLKLANPHQSLRHSTMAICLWG